MGVNATVEVAASSTTTVAALTTATGIYLQFNKGEYKSFSDLFEHNNRKSAVVTVNHCQWSLQLFLGPTTVCM
jgi:hypothetical protein